MSLKIIKAEDLKPGDRYIRVLDHNKENAWPTGIKTYPETVAGGLPFDEEVVLLPHLKPTWPTGDVISIDKGAFLSATGDHTIPPGTLGFRQSDGRYRLVRRGLYLGTVDEDNENDLIHEWHEVDIVISPEGRSAHE